MADGSDGQIIFLTLLPPLKFSVLSKELVETEVLEQARKGLSLRISKCMNMSIFDNYNVQKTFLIMKAVLERSLTYLH